MIIWTEDEGTLDFTELWTALQKWWDAEAVQRLGSLMQKRGGLLMGCPVYGEHYIDVFHRYCVRSLFAGKNLEALRGSVLVVYTDNPSIEKIGNLRAVFAEDGVDVLIKVVPEDVMAAIKHPLCHMWILGIVHQMTMKMAGHWGMGWHMLLADHCYSEEYVPNLLRLAKEHEAIAQSTISADLNSARERLEAWRRDFDGNLIIPARELGEIAWCHLHPQHRPLVVNEGANSFARGSWRIYKGKDSISLYSYTQNAAYMSARLCLESPTIIPATADTQLPHLMPEGAYVPKAHDGLTVIELSGPHKAPAKDLQNLDDWCYLMWNGMKWKDAHLPFFRARNEVPVLESDGWDADRIEEDHAALMDHLESVKAQCALRHVVGSTIA